VHFKNKKVIELVPDDFGKTIDRNPPETWKNLFMILGRNNTGLVKAYQLQDINNALGKIFDNTEIKFFRKNEPIPFMLEIERPGFDQREDYFREEKNRL
jgi:hypothetical protein